MNGKRESSNGTDVNNFGKMCWTEATHKKTLVQHQGNKSSDDEGNPKDPPYDGS
jgi:hypothetical protein